MKFKKLFAYTFSTLFSLSLSITPAQALNGLVAFGDSLTDNGNTSRRFSEYIIPSFIWTIPNTKRYYEGRFTNGLVWIEHVADNLDLPLEDEAQGSAHTITDAVRIPILYPSGLVLSLVNQVEEYIESSYNQIDSEKLYILWSGGNDYLISYEHDTNQIVDAITETVETLYNAGARKFLVMNLPDLTLAPFVREGGTKWTVAELKKVLKEHNTKLANNIHNIKRTLTKAHIELYDIDTMLQNILKHPRDYGFQNTIDRCYEGGYIFKWGDPFPPGSATSSLFETIEKNMMYSSNLEYRDNVCMDPGSYLFWDAMHPTAHTHEVFASVIGPFIKKNY